MILTLKVKADSYEAMKSQLVTEANYFFNGRRFGFSDVQVEMEGNTFAAEAQAYEVSEPRRRSTKVDVPAEEWDPFTGQYGDWAY